jgi:hypothetical protein
MFVVFSFTFSNWEYASSSALSLSPVSLSAAPRYAFIKFDKELEKKRKQYSDPQSRQNLSKLNESLEVCRGGKSETERVEREKVKRGEESEKARALRE